MKEASMLCDLVPAMPWWLTCLMRLCAGVTMPTSRTAFALIGMETPFASNGPILAVLA
jgi:hypothetical protein